MVIGKECYSFVDDAPKLPGGNDVTQAMGRMWSVSLIPWLELLLLSYRRDGRISIYDWRSTVVCVACGEVVCYFIAPRW